MVLLPGPVKTQAMAPKAPCVLVWESPQAIVVPGWVMPCSGPTMCTMPCFPVARSKKVMPCSRQLRRSALIIASASGSAYGSLTWSVGTMWSTVANVRWGISTVSPRSRSMPNACGLVTSWIRWVPMSSWVWPLASVRTVCVSQTFWKSDLDMGWR